MRLVTFTLKDSATERAPRLGALINDDRQVLDFCAIMGVNDRGPETSSGDPSRGWFDLDGPWLSKARAIHDEMVRDTTRLEKNPTIVHRRADIQLMAPVPRPGKLICIGLNYHDHAVESKMAVPEKPVIFAKYTTAVIGPDQPVIIPPTSNKVDFEAELAVVIGRRAKTIIRESAFDHVLGYMNFNDVSARDFQFADGQWVRGKSCDTFAPMGPFIATTDEIPDPHRLPIKFRLNGQTLQDSNTNQLIFGVDELVAYLSETITLEPGDVIATGTPPGVGFARTPPLFLKHGDVMAVEVEGLGVLTNPVIQQTVDPE